MVHQNNQADLENATEVLSGYLERDISQDSLQDIKQKVQDKYRLVKEEPGLLPAPVTFAFLDFKQCFMSLQILWEQAKSAAAARAWRLWEGPVGVHWGLRTHPNAMDSWVSWQTRALMQFNRAARAFCRLSFDRPTTFASFFSWICLTKSSK